MGFFLNPVKRITPADQETPAKWYPVQYTTKLMDETEAAELIADETTFNQLS